MGLGPGGNVPLYMQQPRAPRDGGNGGPEDGDSSGSSGGEEGGGDGRGGGGGGGGGRGGGAAGGQPQRSYARKEKNKAAVGNHHRKDKAMRKMGL